MIKKLIIIIIKITNKNGSSGLQNKSIVLINNKIKKKIKTDLVKKIEVVIK
jgi:hypothetical protein